MGYLHDSWLFMSFFENFCPIVAYCCCFISKIYSTYLTLPYIYPPNATSRWDHLEDLSSFDSRGSATVDFRVKRFEDFIPSYEWKEVERWHQLPPGMAAKNAKIRCDVINKNHLSDLSVIYIYIDISSSLWSLNHDLCIF